MRSFYKILPIVLLFVFFVRCKQHRTRVLSSKEKKEYKENLLKANKGLVKQDHSDIRAYIEAKGWNMQQTETGLWYEIVEHGSGNIAKEGQVAHMRYQVSLIDGTICYSSDSLGIKEFKIGHGGVESGLEEAVLLLHEGDKARFIMPPYMAYGLLGDENKIPPRSTIVYFVELIKLTDY